MAPSAVCPSPIFGSLCQGVHDHRTGHRCGWPSEQGHNILLDPCERASVRLLGSRVIVEDADRCDRIVRCIDHIVGYEAWDITDDWNGALFDPASQLFGHAGLGFALTYGGVHRNLLRRYDCPRPATAAITVVLDVQRVFRAVKCTRSIRYTTHPLGTSQPFIPSGLTRLSTG